MTIDLKQIRKGLRKHRGLQSRICRELGISHNTFWKWKREQFTSARIEASVIAHLCRAQSDLRTTARRGD
jgi:hypothetical protein